MNSTRILISTPIQNNVNAKINNPEDQIAQSIIPPSWEGEMTDRAIRSRPEILVIQFESRTQYQVDKLSLMKSMSIKTFPIDYNQVSS